MAVECLSVGLPKGSPTVAPRFPRASHTVTTVDAPASSWLAGLSSGRLPRDPWSGGSRPGSDRNIHHPTSNARHPMIAQGAVTGGSMLAVGCWMFLNSTAVGNGRGGSRQFLGLLQSQRAAQEFCGYRLPLKPRLQTGSLLPNYDLRHHRRCRQGHPHGSAGR